MEESVIYTNDFIGFYFNGKHSSELGILRVSDGSRYNDNLLPTLQDKTVQVPGGDGTYYFGSYFTDKQISVQYAFDGLYEDQYEALRKWLGTKKVCDLIFDEAPYKVYRAKVTSQGDIKTICFDESVQRGKTDTDGFVRDKRIYKGEGSITFTAYYPYAKSQFKTLDEYEAKGYKKEENQPYEWAKASGILTKTDYEAEENEYDVFVNNTIKTYNPGVIPADFNLIIPVGDCAFKIEDETFSLSGVSAQGEDTYLSINTKLNLVEGLDDSLSKTGNIYNRYATGVFAKIPCGTNTIVFTMAPSSATIEYNYWYF